jgi:hypothetical protein
MYIGYWVYKVTNRINISGSVLLVAAGRGIYLELYRRWNVFFF